MFPLLLKTNKQTQADKPGQMGQVFGRNQATGIPEHCQVSTECSMLTPLFALGPRGKVSGAASRAKSVSVILRAREQISVAVPARANLGLDDE